MFILVQAGAGSPQSMFLQLYQAAELTATCTDSESLESSYET